MIVVIDNYDSFTYNLVQMMGSLGADINVYRNDCISVEELDAMAPSGIVISPGPCTPAQGGISIEAVRHFFKHIPILGVCLGHQAIAAAFGANIVNAKRIMHGKTSLVSHDATPLYEGIKDPFPAGRYHSLAVERDSLAREFLIDATSDDGEIMGIRHESLPVHGVQFHPESVLTPSGKRLLRNFLGIVQRSMESSTRNEQGGQS
ncbi:MAG: aminodeoxychorismate/anthranilate synthase component II [Lentisphaerales bacterium]|jgi:anthranilate synthase/aminodeoxychorismate synthase-like glutamine amidotransferase|nr:MAG: aminodeoxychorismate/anthranilate synthase component II [Lentisphaerales bacterium]